MDFKNKSFKDNQTGEIIRIIDSYQNIAVTDKRDKIDTNRLSDTRYYTEYIDPKSFFGDSATYNLFIDKIKNVDLSKVPDDTSSPGEIKPIISNNSNDFSPTTNDSAVVMYDPEEEKQELMRKYGATTDQSAISKQNEAFAKLLGEDESIQTTAVNTPLNMNKSGDLIDNHQSPVITEQRVVQKNTSMQTEDPIITIFRNAKKNVDFSFTLDINNKIPRLDFIEMMEDSYEKSIIEFLADEFTSDLLKNPDKIKSKIVEEIKKLINKKLGDGPPQTKPTLVKKARARKKESEQK